MKTDEVALSFFFGDQKNQYLIPQWQRKYSWTRVEIDELWGDVLRVAGDILADQSPTHFLGSIVVQQQSPDVILKPSEAKRFVVIDGQQRLVTTALLFCALRDAEPGTITAGATHITTSYLTNTTLKDSYRQRLVLQDSDNDAYRQVVQGLEYPDPEHPIVDAYEHSRELMSEALRSPELGATINARADLILTVLDQCLTTVWLGLGPTDNAHRIFQTINASGKPLEAFDLVRNYFFLRLSANHKTSEDFYESYWTPMESRLQAPGKHEKSFMQAWSNYRGRTGTRDSLYSDFVQDLKGLSVAEVEEYGKQFTEASKNILPLVEPVELPDSSCTEELTLFRLLKQAPQSVVGLLFAALTLAERAQLEYSTVTDVARSVNSFLVRRQLAGYPTQLHNAAFRDVVVGFMTLLAKGDVEPSEMGDFVKAKLSVSTETRKWPTDADVLQDGLTADLYTSAQRRHLTRVVLGIIDQRMRPYPGSAYPIDAYANMELEHVMPQDLSSVWIENLVQWGDAEPSLVHRTYLHSLGNLSLIEGDGNSGIGNRPFHEKRKFFETETLQISKQIRHAPIWTSEQIRSRATELLQIALTAFTPPLDDEERASAAARFGLQAETDESGDEDLEDD